MTDWPCLADTDSITLSIVDGALEADLVLDPDATNGLYLNGTGLAADPQFYPSGRLTAAGVVQNVGSGSPITLGTTRWAVGGIVVAGSTLVTNTPGLWMFGGTVSFNTAAAVGSVQAFVGPVGGFPNPARDACDSLGASGFTETITLSPTNLYELAAGVALQMTILHNFGGTIPTVAADGVMAELWAILIKPYVAA